MAAGAFVPYHNGLLKIATGSVDFQNDTLKAALVKSTYTPAASTHDHWDDISANECDSADYTAITIASAAISLTGGKVRFDIEDLDYGDEVTISAKYCVIYKDTGTASTSPVLFYVDLNSGGSSVESTAGDYDVTISANGVYEITP